MKKRSNKENINKANRLHKVDADNLRYDQVYYENAPLQGSLPSVNNKFPGKPYIDLGTTSAMYSELVSTRSFGDNFPNFATGAPAIIDYGTISNDDTGADWKLTDGVLVPNTAAEQIELKAGLIEAKIRNSMYTELDILNYVPTIDTKLQNSVVASGQIYVRYMMASKYNTFVIARFWADLQAAVRGCVLMARNNKLLVERVNMLLNELRRSRIQAALQSLTSASTMIMTDSWMWDNVISTTGCSKVDESLMSPIITIGASLNRDMYKNKDSWLELKKTASDPSAETKYKLTLDFYTLTSMQALVQDLLTKNDDEWIAAVGAFGQDVLKGAQSLTLSISSLQHIYQVLNTALTQIGQSIISDRFGFRPLSVDIFGKPSMNPTSILNYNILRFATVDYNTTGSLTRTVSAKVPCNIASLPVDAFKTNFVLATKDYGDDYKALVDVSDLYIHKINFFVYSQMAGALPCHNINAYWSIYTPKVNDSEFYGITTKIPVFDMSGYSNGAVLSLRKFLNIFEPIYRYGKVTARLDWAVSMNVYGVTTVSYLPIYDKILLRAVTNFGLLDN